MKPEYTIQKVMFSTACLIKGEYNSELFRIAHAWPQSSDAFSPDYSDQTTPISRNYYVLSFRTAPYEIAPGVVIPSYSWIADSFAAILTVYFGKLFWNHGFIEENGMFQIPSRTEVRLSKTYEYPFHSTKPRANLGVELNFDNLSSIHEVFQFDEKLSFLNILISAGKFYRRALEKFEEDPEASYVDLVTAGEVISNVPDYSDEELFDEEWIKTFETIEKYVPEEEQIVGFLKGKLYQVRRKYTLTLLRGLDESFYSSSDGTENSSRIVPEKAESTIKASYDIRSKYVHTGSRFGTWIVPYKVALNEMVIGRPGNMEKEFSKTVSKAPTFVGLEKMVRYALYRYIDRYLGKLSGGE
jgi:hypothetical protein